MFYVAAACLVAWLIGEIATLVWLGERRVVSRDEGWAWALFWWLLVIMLAVRGLREALTRDR